MGVSRLFTCRRELVSEFVVVVHCLGGWVLAWLFGCVGVVCELDSVFVCFLCLFFVFECFWLGLLAGLCVWLVFLGFNVFVFVRRV